MTQPADLKTLFTTKEGQEIQRLLADALTQAQIRVTNGASTTAAQQELATFLTDCLAKLNAGYAVVVNGQNVVVQDNGGGVNAKSPGVANVTLGVLNYVRLQP